MRFLRLQVSMARMRHRDEDASGGCVRHIAARVNLPTTAGSLQTRTFGVRTSPALAASIQVGVVAERLSCSRPAIGRLPTPATPTTTLDAPGCAWMHPSPSLGP
jgi:hypothetical protein